MNKTKRNEVQSGQDGSASYYYKSSVFFKNFAKVLWMTFILAGVYVIYKYPADWAFGSLFIIIGVVHLVLISRHVAEVCVMDSRIKILKRHKESVVPFDSVIEIKQITYGTKKLWRMKCRNTENNLYFFSNYKMIEFFKKNGIEVIWYRLFNLRRKPEEK